MRRDLCQRRRWCRRGWDILATVMQYLQLCLYILGGLVLIAAGAHGFIDGTTAFAQRLRIPPLIAGLVVVGMATSAPELMVSVVASLSDHTSMAVGNAVGSNIANIAMVLGVVALIRTVVPPPSLLRQVCMLMLGGTLLGVLVLWNLHLARWEGLLLLGVLGLVMWQVVRWARQRPAEEVAENPAMTLAWGWGRILLYLLAGLAMLLFGSKWMVDAAVRLAQLLGVSDLVIGLTIVAIGTSLPELAASVTAALKGRTEITVGNILGSNLFNILGIVGTCALLAPGALDASLSTRDLPVLIGISLLLGLLLRRPLRRRHGLLLLSGFCGYQVMLWSGGAAA